MQIAIALRLARELSGLVQAVNMVKQHERFESSAGERDGVGEMRCCANFKN